MLSVECWYSLAFDACSMWCEEQEWVWLSCSIAKCCISWCHQLFNSHPPHYLCKLIHKMCTIFASQWVCCSYSTEECMLSWLHYLLIQFRPTIMKVLCDYRNCIGGDLSYEQCLLRTGTYHSVAQWIHQTAGSPVWPSSIANIGNIHPILHSPCWHKYGRWTLVSIAVGKATKWTPLWANSKFS